MLDIVPSNQFKKRPEACKKRGLKIDKLRKVVNTLAEQKILDDKYRDHSLTGEYREFRECHIEPDWLLIYRINNNELELFLFRTGTHSDLFQGGYCSRLFLYLSPSSTMKDTFNITFINSSLFLIALLTYISVCLKQKYIIL